MIIWLAGVALIAVGVWIGYKLAEKEKPEKTKSKYIR